MKFSSILKQKCVRSGDFGVNECKKTITNYVLAENLTPNEKEKQLFDLLYEYYKRAKKDCFFNNYMINATIELIDELE